MRVLILASGSPRRKQLLEQLGLAFTIDPPDVDESVFSEEQADAYVSRLSESKARAVMNRSNEDAVVLAADTTVLIDGNILGKPESKQHGLEMLTTLSGSTHKVLTGVTVCCGTSSETLCVETEVVFRELGQAEIEWYWNTGEPADKAGAYGLQGIGAAFVNTLKGSYTNVIGLPLSETVMLLREHSIECLGQKEFS